MRLIAKKGPDFGYFPNPPKSWDINSCKVGGILVGLLEVTSRRWRGINSDGGNVGERSKKTLKKSGQISQDSLRWPGDKFAGRVTVPLPCSTRCWPVPPPHRGGISP